MKFYKKICITLLSALLFLSPLSVCALGDYADTAINIDGYFDDWEGVPSFILCYGSRPPIEHHVYLLRDDNYVYLRVQMADHSYMKFNGYNYIFTADGTQVNFVVTEDYCGNVTVRYEEGWSAVGGSSGCIYHGKNGKSDQCEIAIPLVAFETNGTRGATKVKAEDISTITFTTPNLGHQIATITGTSTFPFINVGAGVLCAGGGFVLFNKKRKVVK